MSTPEASRVSPPRSPPMTRSESRPPLASARGLDEQHFAEVLASKIGELCRTLVSDYEDLVNEAHTTQCSRIRNGYVEQELKLRAEISILQERNTKLSEQLKNLEQKGDLPVCKSCPEMEAAQHCKEEDAEGGTAGAQGCKPKAAFWSEIGEHPSAPGEGVSESVATTAEALALPGWIPCMPSEEMIDDGSRTKALSPKVMSPLGQSEMGGRSDKSAEKAMRSLASPRKPTSPRTISDMEGIPIGAPMPPKHVGRQPPVPTTPSAQIASLEVYVQNQPSNTFVDGRTPRKRVSEASHKSSTSSATTRTGTVDARNSAERTAVRHDNNIEDYRHAPSRFMMHPNSWVSMAKDVLSVCFLIWDGLSLPFVMAWDPKPTLGLQIASIVLMLFWTGEMFVTMNTGFYANGVLEMRRSRALLYYVKRWFIIDLITVGTDWVNCVLDLISSKDDSSLGIELIRLVKLNRLMRLARAFRVMKVYEHLKNIGHNISGIYLTGSWSMLFKICQYVVYIFLLNHIVACLWFAIGKYFSGASDTGRGWLEAHTMAIDGVPTTYADLGMSFQYLTCLHFAVSNTVQGSASIDPVNSLERWFTVCCSVVGFVIASMLVSTLSSWLVQVQMLKQEKVVTMAALRRFLRENAVCTSLANRIDQHVLARISVSPRLQEAQVDALEFLTPALRGELRTDMWSRYALTNPMFHTWRGLDQKVMEAICMTAVTPTYLENGEELFTPNSKAEKAFVLTSGSLSYSQFTKSKIFKHRMKKRRPGELDNAFGELNDNTHQVVNPVCWLADAILWVPWTFQGTASATAESELLAFSPEIITKVLSKRTHLMQMLSDYRQAFHEKLSMLDNADLSDIGACIPHFDVVMGMQIQSRVLLGVPALRTLKQRYAFRGLFGDSLDRLEDEITHGTRVLTLDTTGNVVRIGRAVALRVRRPDGRVLMQLGSAKTGFSDKEPRLPTVTLRHQEPEEGLSDLLSGDLAIMAAALTFGQSSCVMTTATSRTYANISVQNVYINMVYSVAISADVQLPGKVDVGSAAEYLKNMESYNQSDIAALHEVYLLRGAAEEEICCAWLLPDGEEDVVMRRQSHRKEFPAAPAPALLRRSIVNIKGAPGIPNGPGGAGGDSVQSFSIASRRLPFPKLLHDKPLPSLPPETGVPLLRSLLKDRKTDWHRARRAAQCICDPEYSCEDFFHDCIAAFPELGLYVIGSNPMGSYSTDQSTALQATTGVRTTDDEYQRTMGAFFSFFWLMRLGLEGPDSFSFGLNEQWQPRRPHGDAANQTDETRRRLAFRQNADWDAMHQLLEDAGILKRTAVASEAQHDPERTLAMLSLTAYHDIMKVQALLPTVEEKHGSWCGFKAGEVIDDHDAALGYVLEHHADLLPSFTGLPQAAQRSVRFTQCKMEYNMGWLVQAEAPPGPLLSTLRRTAQTGHASQEDIAFYFVHWFTDLAGAVPTPLAGSEKFVLGFPLKVLSSFLSSFSIVADLGNLQSETQVCENYLRWRWESHKPALGPPPSGAGAIAKMRLVIMAQGNSKLILDAFSKLPEADRRLLSEELARTGCQGQSYTTDRLQDTRGPAILVYYGPAFLQKAGLLDPLGAMQVLAELLRQARAMWPLKTNLSGVSVTLRIDALKAETVQACRRPALNEAWVLEKVSERSASVCRVPLPQVRDGMDWSNRCILNFTEGAAAAA